MALLLHAASAFALAPRGLPLQSVACGEVLTDADALACGRRHWHRRHRRERQPRAACRAATMRLGGPEDDAVASSAWRWAKRSLPLLVTGASGSDGDAAPEAALFNLVLIRAPFLLACAALLVNVLLGGGIVLSGAAWPQNGAALHHPEAVRGSFRSMRKPPLGAPPPPDSAAWRELLRLRGGAARGAAAGWAGGAGLHRATAVMGAAPSGGGRG